MFGDINNNYNNFHKSLVGDVAESIDPQPSHRTPPVEQNGIPYIGIAECNYKTRTIDFNAARKVSKTVLDEHINRYQLKEGDFIIGKIGTIGKPFFIPSDRTYVLSANTVLIRPDEKKVNPIFLLNLFESEMIDRQIKAEQKSTSQPAFGIQKVRNLSIINPPLSIQNDFAAFVQQIDKSKFEIANSLKRMYNKGMLS